MKKHTDSFSQNNYIKTIGNYLPFTTKTARMKNYSLLAIILIIVSSCSHPAPQVNSEKSQLAELQNQEKEINAKIHSLQAKIGEKDTSNLASQKVVEVTRMEYKPFFHFITTQGLVQSDQNLAVVPEAQGVYTSIYVHLGEQVHKGQALGKVDDQVLQRNLDQALTLLSLDKILYEKRKKLWAQNIGTEVDFLTSKNTMENQQDQVATLRQQIALTVLTAPVSGSIDEINARLGESANPSTPAFRVVNSDILKVTSGLSESYLGRVKTGTPVILMFTDINKKIKTHVDFVGSALDMASRTFPVQSKLYHEKGIKPNMSADVSIQDYYTASALTVPVDALQSTLDGQFVFVLSKDAKNQNIVLKKTVIPGLTQDGEVQITKGLNVGDQVITTGYRGLEDQQPVQL